MYACQTLVDTANNFIVRNFEQVFRQNCEEFCRQVEDVEELSKWLEEDSLFITSEDFLLKVKTDEKSIMLTLESGVIELAIMVLLRTMFLLLKNNTAL